MFSVGMCILYAATLTCNSLYDIREMDDMNNIRSVLNNYMTGGELDYYLVKETTDAAMEDALDTVYLRTCGLPRIDKEKFVENFVYRLYKYLYNNYRKIC